MISERLRRQDGLVRDVVKYLALFVVVLILVLDAVSVIQTQVSVRQQAGDAADVARSTYVESGSTRSAQQTAESYLKAHDTVYVSSTVNAVGGRDKAVVSVTAERHAKTYVYKYLTHVPWVGDRIENLLNPIVIGETNKSAI